MQPDSIDNTPAPSMAPTLPYTPGSLDSLPIDPDTYSFHGIQFDVESIIDSDIFVNSFEVKFETSGTYNLEVWSREGTHKGTSTSNGCNS